MPDDEDRELEQVAVRLPRWMIRQLKERSERDDRTVAQSVRRAVRLYLKDGPS